MVEIDAEAAWTAAALLTSAEMAECDRLTIAEGLPGPLLMEQAGGAVTAALRERWRPRPVAVLCGPGNNGGDGFVVARQLAEQGWPVRLGCTHPVAQLGGDARHHAERWPGPVEPLSPALLADAQLVVDALFGSGLNRPLHGAAADAVAAIAGGGLPSIAIDIPSGVSGDSGAVLGLAARATLTVTFFRAKPGHYLLPGRAYIGELVVADIGIPERQLARVRPRCALNGPALWQLPRPALGGHKYSRGYLLIRGGGEMSGAARLAARAARRVGAGMVAVAAPEAARLAYLADQPGLILRGCDSDEGFAAVLEDRRIHALLVGPGNGRGSETRAAAVAALATGRPTLLDADALTVFPGGAAELAGAIAGPTVLTPHDGEFAALFGALAGDKLARARAAAKASGATLLLKGADTVIAHPDGRVLINANAPAELATAGAGDVLAGLIGGLLAQGLAPFAAAAAGAWLHGAAAAAAGPALIAEDLAGQLGAVIAAILKKVR